MIRHLLKGHRQWNPDMLKSRKWYIHVCYLEKTWCKQGHIFKCQMNQLSSLYRKDEFGQRLITLVSLLAERPTEADPEGFMA